MLLCDATSKQFIKGVSAPTVPELGLFSVCSLMQPMAAWACSQLAIVSPDKFKRGPRYCVWKVWAESSHATRFAMHVALCSAWRAKPRHRRPLQCRQVRWQSAGAAAQELVGRADPEPAAEEAEEVRLCRSRSMHGMGGCKGAAWECIGWVVGWLQVLE